MMKPLIYCFAALAAIGLALSVASHLAALQAKSGPLGNYTWTLHLGALAVCVPAALVARRLTRGVPREDQLKALLAGCPTWMRYTLYGFLGYAVVNFAIFMLTPHSGGTGPMPASVVRGFSGHWMAIYAGALAILYSGAKQGSAV
jgi:membrane protease YdiL (CAAX protease family)